MTPTQWRSSLSRFATSTITLCRLQGGQLSQAASKPAGKARPGRHQLWARRARSSPRRDRCVPWNQLIADRRWGRQLTIPPTAGRPDHRASWLCDAQVPGLVSADAGQRRQEHYARRGAVPLSCRGWVSPPPCSFPSCCLALAADTTPAQTSGISRSTGASSSTRPSSSSRPYGSRSSPSSRPPRASRCAARRSASLMGMRGSRP